MITYGGFEALGALALAVRIALAVAQLGFSSWWTFSSTRPSLLWWAPLAILSLAEGSIWAGQVPARHSGGLPDPFPVLLLFACDTAVVLAPWGRSMVHDDVSARVIVGLLASWAASVIIGVALSPWSLQVRRDAFLDAVHSGSSAEIRFRMAFLNLGNTVDGDAFVPDVLARAGNTEVLDGLLPRSKDEPQGELRLVLTLGYAAAAGQTNVLALRWGSLSPGAQAKVLQSAVLARRSDVLDWAVKQGFSLEKHGLPLVKHALLEGTESQEHLLWLLDRGASSALSTDDLCSWLRGLAQEPDVSTAQERAAKLVPVVRRLLAGGAAREPQGSGEYAQSHPAVLATEAGSLPLFELFVARPMTETVKAYGLLAAVWRHPQVPELYARWRALGANPNVLLDGSRDDERATIMVRHLLSHDVLKPYRDPTEVSVKLLLDAGVSMKPVGRLQWTPLHVAILAGRADLAHLLLKQPDLDMNAKAWGEDLLRFTWERFSQFAQRGDSAESVASKLSLMKALVQRGAPRSEMVFDLVMHEKRRGTSDANFLRP